MQRPRPAVICLSGGMDSTSLLVRLLAERRKVFGLCFDYGQKHRLELERLYDNIEYLRSNDIEMSCETIEIPKLGDRWQAALTAANWQVPKGHYEQENMRQTVVPNRNAIFASIAYGYALSIAIQRDTHVDFCLGVHAGDHAIYPDCRPEFYQSIFHAFSIGNWDNEKVHLHIPYINGDKHTILQEAAGSIEKLGLDFDTVFRNTCTSYQPDSSGRSHGLTGSDVERILAFHKFNRRDPIDYVDRWEVVVEKALELEARYRAESETPFDR